MITKQAIKDVRALILKKNRDASHLFLAEGPKVVGDLLPLLRCKKLFATSEYLKNVPFTLLKQIGDVYEAKQQDLERMSLLQSPRNVIAMFEKPKETFDLTALADLPTHSLCLALDDVQDPGNVGTIVRLADWFGIEHIFATPLTADVFAPKVVQSTMGAIGRIHIHYVDIVQLLTLLPNNVPIYGTFLEGSDIYHEKLLSSNGVIVMGNEGRGISEKVSSLVNSKLFIPPYPIGRETSESLNVAVATAIVCSEFRRRQI